MDALRVAAELTDDPKIKEMMRRADLVRMEVVGDEVKVWTTKGKEYAVRRAKKTGDVYCTCPAWIFRKRFGNETCKHVLAVLGSGMKVPNR